MVLIKAKILFYPPLNWFSRITQKSNIAKNGKKRWFCWQKTTLFCEFAPGVVSCFVHKRSKLGLDGSDFGKNRERSVPKKGHLVPVMAKTEKSRGCWQSFRLLSWSPCSLVTMRIRAKPKSGSSAKNSRARCRRWTMDPNILLKERQGWWISSWIAICRARTNIPKKSIKHLDAAYLPGQEILPCHV